MARTKFDFFEQPHRPFCPPRNTFQCGSRLVVVHTGHRTDEIIKNIHPPQSRNALHSVCTMKVSRDS
eukprot:scaffold5444_cov157-Amphora_coffeaeformis.AAC.5